MSPTPSDAELETRIVMAWHDYQAAPRERQRALWGKLALLIGQRDERQETRQALRLVK